jgi:hypothetical protein
VRHDNCLSFDGTVLQIPRQRRRCNFVKTKVAIELGAVYAVRLVELGDGTVLYGAVFVFYIAKPSWCLITNTV